MSHLRTPCRFFDFRPIRRGRAFRLKFKNRAGALKTVLV